MSERVTRRLQIRGRVQGVWFRESMRIEAERLGVTGWVRNRRDGSVEAVIQGEPGVVESMTAWTRRGPPSAVVNEVKIAGGTDDYATFETLPTE